MLSWMTSKTLQTDRLDLYYGRNPGELSLAKLLVCSLCLADLRSHDRDATLTQTGNFGSSHPAEES